MLVLLVGPTYSFSTLVWTIPQLQRRRLATASATKCAKIKNARKHQADQNTITKAKKTAPSHHPLIIKTSHSTITTHHGDFTETCPRRHQHITERSPKHHQKNKKQHQNNTETSPKTTETRPRHHRDETDTRPRQDRDTTET